MKDQGISNQTSRKSLTMQERTDQEPPVLKDDHIQ